MKMKLKNVVLLLPILLLASCTLDKSAVDAIQQHYDLGDYVYDCPEPVACPVVTCPKPKPCAVCPELPEQPPVVIESEPDEPETIRDDFSNGTLWKPVSDHNPDAVVLIEGKYNKQFDACYYYKGGEAKKMTCKKWEDGRWIPTCFTNAHQGMLRQTWRAQHKCNEIDSVKVTCKLKGDNYIFEKAGANTCLRHE